jgi:putative flippase GtrA
MIGYVANFYQSHPKEFNKFIKFSLVGVLGTVIDFTLFNLLLYVLSHVLGWSLLAQFGLNGNLLVANTISFGAGVLNNYTWNRLWTFKESRKAKKRQQLMKFAMVSLVGLLLNSLLVLTLAAILGPYVSEPLSYNLAKVIATGLVLFWNFGANRFWTFRAD